MSSKTHINSLQAGAFYHKSENENRNFGKQGKKNFIYMHARKIKTDKNPLADNLKSQIMSPVTTYVL